MRAVRIHGAEDLRIESIEPPEIEPGKVLLRGGFSGICGSDLHLFYVPATFPWNFTEPAALTGARWPQIFGHEFSGRVEEVGEGVAGLEAGDFVAVFPYHYCGDCRGCRSGKYTSCSQMAFEGIQGRSGGMAETKIVDAAQCFVLPEGVDLKMGALVEPMAVAWHGVEISKIAAGGAALVMGGGPIGLGAYFALKARGAGTVVLSEPSLERREILQRVGVEHVVDPFTEDVVERVRGLTDGRGVDVTVDTAGVPVAFADGMAALALGGTMVVVAAYESPIEFSPYLLAGDKSVRSSAVYTREDFGQVIDAMSRGMYVMQGGWLEVVSFDGVHEALNRLRRGLGMKILVETPGPSGSASGL